MNQFIKAKTPKITDVSTGILQLGIILLGLYTLSLYNYLLFHSLTEVFTVIISLAIFLIVWNSRQFIQNNYFIIIGISFGIIGFLDLFHAFIYKGTSIVTIGGNSNQATQLWIASRYLTSLSFFIAAFFIRKKISAKIVLTLNLLVLAAIFLSIFYFHNFPLCYIEGTGLTPFKKVSEYIISLIFLADLILLHIRRRDFDKKVYNLLSLVLVIMIVAELMFTLYVGVYDHFNLIGHLLRILAVYFSYIAIVEYSLKRPFRLIFKNLKDSETALDKEKTKLTHILDAMDDGVSMVTADYNILYVNPSLIKQFGPLNEKKCYQYFHNRSEPCSWCKNSEIFQGETVRWEWHFDKINKTFELIDNPVEGPNGVFAKLELFHDISERKEIEKAKDEFLSLASHQLRTPLASISLSSELLLRGVSGQVQPEQKEYLQEIYNSTKKMAALVNNLLNVSRIQMNTFEINYEPIDINGQIMMMVNEIMPQIREKQITLNTLLDNNIPAIQSDSNAFHIVIDNLLSNALRYTNTQGKITIFTKKINNYAVVKIQDTGCGIPADQQDKVFSKSFRATNAIKACADGTGLGLYMVKVILDKLGYFIKFSSTENKGTTFTLEIPIK